MSFFVLRNRLLSPGAYGLAKKNDIFSRCFLASFSTQNLDMHEGGQRQPYLGFLIDEAMIGMAHQDRAIAMGHSHVRKVGEVSPRMGEDNVMGMNHD